ncbi:MAG: pirin family protein [Flammeovirgaceae bacterium]
MSNVDLIIEERSRDIGDFLVGRILPFREKRMVGPFIFIDHMGPSTISPGHHLDVDQHPHIGLSTLTYLLKGAMQHRDSLGTDQRITPGSVNWMTAGKGVTHTERTPQDLRGQTFEINGYQIWVALPKELEDTEPSFHHIPAEKLPTWSEGGADFTLVAGKGFGKSSPVPVHSDLFMVEVIANERFQLDIQGQLSGEIGVCIVEGQIQACEHNLGKGNMLVSKVENTCSITMEANTHLFLFGGQPFEENRYITWNFVATSKEKINQAIEDWKAHKFPKVPNDDTYVPMPPMRLKMK